MATIKIRHRKCKNGMFSTYLDIHNNGKRFSKFFPDLKYKMRTTTKSEKEQKQRVLQIVNKRKLEIEEELLAGTYVVDTCIRTDIDFVIFFQNFIDNHNYKDKRVYEAVLKKVKAFFKSDKILFSEINTNSMQKFVFELEKNLNATTPFNYIKKIKQVVKAARKQKLIKHDVFEDVKLSKRASTIKDVLSSKDLELLWKSHCGNPSVKRAFFLSCFTGLRWCDVKVLKWGDIKSDRIQVVQLKTGVSLTIPLSNDAKKLFSKRGNQSDFVFNLPSHTGCNKSLGQWVKIAGIEKHITWHSARHTLGATLLNVTGDLLATSKILGHTSLKYTTGYTRYNNESLKNAIYKCPSVFTINNK